MEFQELQVVVVIQDSLVFREAGVLLEIQALMESRDHKEMLVVLGSLERRGTKDPSVWMERTDTPGSVGILDLRESPVTLVGLVFPALMGSLDVWVPQDTPVTLGYWETQGDMDHREPKETQVLQV